MFFLFPLPLKDEQHIAGVSISSGPRPPTVIVNHGLESGRPSYETCVEQVWTFPSDLLVRLWIAAEWIYCFWAASLTELTSGFYFSSWCHTPLGDNSRLSNPRPATAACCWAGFSEINTLDFVCMCEKRICCKIMKSTVFQGIFCDGSGWSWESGQVLDS